MWGLALRIQGDQVDASVPGWLLNATATHATITLAKRAAIELTARADLYAFDPAAVYTILVQTWDRATTDIRSVAYGRNIAGQRDVGLLLDFYYTAAHGFRDLRRDAVGLPRWVDRSDRLAWRGSVTGDNTIVEPGDLPRVQLAVAARDWADADIGLIGVHSTMHNGRPSGVLEAYVAAHRLQRERWNMVDFGRYKYVIDIDGHANAWGFMEKLILGCCVLKVDSPYEQWFYDRIRPWEHYVPVRGDLSNLRETIDWCRENDAHCRWIGANGARLAASLTPERELPNTCRALIAAAHVRRVPPRRHAPIPRPAPLFQLEDAVHRAEDLGLLDDAVDAYRRVIEAGLGNAGTLIRRHSLLRERGDFAAAQADMERAITAEPENDEPCLRLAQFLALIGRDGAAAGLLKTTIALAPDRDEIHVSLAGSLLKLGWVDAAFGAVRDLPDGLPGWWADLRLEAMDAFASARLRTRTLLRERREYGGLADTRAEELALALFALGRLNVAARLCAVAAERDPTAFAPVELAIRIMRRRQGPEAALHHLSTAPAAAGADERYAWLRAGLLFDLGRYEEVLEGVHDATEDPGSVARSQVAIAMIMLDRRADLVRYGHQWMECSPHDMRPAELICASQPAPPLPPVADQSALSIGLYWPSDTVPDAAQEVMNSWTELHPGMRRQVFHAESARAFLLAHCDSRTARAFDFCADETTRRDFFRFAWLLRHGGIWVAADQRCIRPVRPVLAAAAASGIAAVRSGYITGFLRDAMLGARAGSTLIEIALRTATTLILDTAERQEPLWAWRATGPGLLTHLVAASIGAHGGVSDELLLTPTLYDSFAVTAC